MRIRDWDIVESGGLVPCTDVGGIDWQPLKIVVVIVYWLVAAGAIPMKANCSWLSLTK